MLYARAAGGGPFLLGAIRFVLEGDWQGAVKASLGKKKPSEGRPKPTQ